MRTRIVWTTEEIELVKNEYDRLVRVPGTPKRIAKVMDLAMKVLSEGRRRNSVCFQGWASLPWNKGGVHHPSSKSSPGVSAVLQAPLGTPVGAQFCPKLASSMLEAASEFLVDTLVMIVEQKVADKLGSTAHRLLKAAGDAHTEIGALIIELNKAKACGNWEKAVDIINQIKLTSGSQAAALVASHESNA